MCLSLNHVFVQLIFMPPEFSLMPRLKSINFYQNKPKIKLFLQKNKKFQVTSIRAPKPQIQPLHPLQVSGYVPDARRVLLILQRFRILQ